MRCIVYSNLEARERVKVEKGDKREKRVEVKKGEKRLEVKKGRREWR